MNCYTRHNYTSQLLYEYVRVKEVKKFMIYYVREIKSFNDVINNDVKTSLLSSVLFCLCTPLHKYVCMKINVIYPRLRFTDMTIPLHIYMEACTEIPFVFIIISQTPSIFLPNQLWSFIWGFATFSFSCLVCKIPFYFTPVEIRIWIKK